MTVGTRTRPPRPPSVRRTSSSAAISLFLDGAASIPPSAPPAASSGPPTASSPTAQEKPNRIRVQRRLDRRQIAAVSWRQAGERLPQAFSSPLLAKISRCSRPPFLWLRPSPTPRNPSPDILADNSCGLATSASSLDETTMCWNQERKDPVLRAAHPHARSTHRDPLPSVTRVAVRRSL